MPFINITLKRRSFPTLWWKKLTRTNYGSSPLAIMRMRSWWSLRNITMFSQHARPISSPESAVCDSPLPENLRRRIIYAFWFSFLEGFFTSTHSHSPVRPGRGPLQSALNWSRGKKDFVCGGERKQRDLPGPWAAILHFTVFRQLAERCNFSHLKSHEVAQPSVQFVEYFPPTLGQTTGKPMRLFWFWPPLCFSY